MVCSTASVYAGCALVCAFTLFILIRTLLKCVPFQPESARQANPLALRALQERCQLGTKSIVHCATQCGRHRRQLVVICWLGEEWSAEDVATNDEYGGKHGSGETCQDLGGSQFEADEMAAHADTWFGRNCRHQVSTDGRRYAGLCRGPKLTGELLFRHISKSFRRK